jgi:hypothetical protein
MTTLRAATLGGGMRRRAEQSLLCRLIEATIKGGFLLPKGLVACEHEWMCLDSGYAVCMWCGKEHWCYCGECPEQVSDAHEHVCIITGCVTLEYVLRPERNASERVGSLALSLSLSLSLFLRCQALSVSCLLCLFRRACEICCTGRASCHGRHTHMYDYDYFVLSWPWC